jgi:predicted 2-oxoglutarate/Fe(II)-dependent dioxygenase YbiX
MLLNSFILQIPNLINLKTVSTLIRYSNTRTFEKGAIGQDGYVVNEKIRKVGRYVLSNASKSLTDCHWNNYLNNRITTLMNEYVTKLNLLKYTGFIKNTNQIEILKYEETNHYDFHVDGGTGFDRVLSAILFLNNDYKGGELSFKTLADDKETIFKPIPGSLIIWPSNFLYPHCVKPVTKGTRYSIVAWA